MSADALRAVRARMERGWAQDADARDAAGQPVSLASESATSWSVCSAFALAAKDGIPMNHVPRALRALADVAAFDAVLDWNDDPSLTQQDVLDALDRAIARVEGGEGG